MARIDRLFTDMLSGHGSDLHLSEGQPPKIRRHGRLVALDHPILTAETMRGYLQEICPAEYWERFLETGDLDFAYALGTVARFRANYFKQSHGMGAVFRTIPAKIKTLDELNLPPVLKTLSLIRSGLVLVTGPTGSGKSTTLAAIIDLINATSSRHILTIEEPIEFVHPAKKSIICQREVGTDVNSFSDGLRAAGRQDCDVVLVGEMRDYETISLAVTAATMGSLVFGTLHTNTAPSTVDRIIDQFPADRQSQVRTMLSESLKGVITQVLCKKIGGGRVPSQEILLVNGAVANLIREGKTFQIPSIMQTSRGSGMQTMNDALFDLVKNKLVQPEDAMAKSLAKADLKSALKRINIDA